MTDSQSNIQGIDVIEPVLNDEELDEKEVNEANEKYISNIIEHVSTKISDNVVSRIGKTNTFYVFDISLKILTILGSMSSITLFYLVSKRKV